MMYCKAKRIVTNEHTSCAVKANDTYKKVCKVDRRESLEKHTQIRKQIPKPPLRTQVKSCQQIESIDVEHGPLSARIPD